MGALPLTDPKELRRLAHQLRVAARIMDHLAEVYLAAQAEAEAHRVRPLDG